MNVNPLISIIVPVYNTAQYLEDCFGSICEQTYRNLEIIAVDDGSTDGSAELLDRLAKNDDRIRVIHQENRGVSAARNTGIAVAQGEYLSFADSDDMLESDMYEILFSAIKKYGCDIAHCSYYRLSDCEKRPIGGSGKVYVQTGIEAQEALLRGRLFTGGLWAKLIRRTLFHDLRLYEDLKINEDILTVFELFQHSHRTVFIDTCKYDYRTSVTSSCAKTEHLRKSQDGITVAERMQDIATDTAIQELIRTRLLQCLILHYRNLLFNGYKKNTVEFGQISHRIQDLINQGVYINRKKLLDYHLMHKLPHVYVVLYSIYNRVRKPNWDIR